jgi:hypothetical protein
VRQPFGVGEAYRWEGDFKIEVSVIYRFKNETMAARAESFARMKVAMQTKRSAV